MPESSSTYCLINLASLSAARAPRRLNRRHCRKIETNGIRQRFIIGPVSTCHQRRAVEQEGSVHHRRVAIPPTFFALIAAVSLAGVTLAGQAAAPKTKAWTPPRASDGHA